MDWVESGVSDFRIITCETKNPSSCCSNIKENYTKSMQNNWEAKTNKMHSTAQHILSQIGCKFLIQWVSVFKTLLGNVLCVYVNNILQYNLTVRQSYLLVWLLTHEFLLNIPTLHYSTSVRFSTQIPPQKKIEHQVSAWAESKKAFNFLHRASRYLCHIVRPIWLLELNYF